MLFAQYLLSDSNSPNVQRFRLVELALEGEGKQGIAICAISTEHLRQQCPAVKRCCRIGTHCLFADGEGTLRQWASFTASFTVLAVVCDGRH